MALACSPAARTRATLAAVLTALGALVLAAPPPASAAPQRQAKQVTNGWIVTYRNSVANPAAKTDRLERRGGFRSRHEYRRALKGFSARLSAAQVRDLRADPDVAFVSPDRVVHALGEVPLATGDGSPTGVRRMAAGTATTARDASGAGIAVIDTGVDVGHRDLNAYDGVNCVNPASSAATDDNGHGTHVAGTIGARNDGSGVVGVAPGSRIAAVKVLDAEGSGTYSQIICGIDWVTATRRDADPGNDIAVANMSLGGAGDPVASCATTTDAMHRAICASTDAGVTYVVAAGNDGWDFDYAYMPDTPAAYPQVLTVSAISDSDGRPGAAGGAPTCRTGEADDRYASFSNFAATSAGAAHTIAAPGVCITSTAPGGGYDVMSGTSMATPHMAGAVALCLDEGGAPGPCAGLDPAGVIAKVRADAARYSNAVSGFGFTGDPLRPAGGRYYGYAQWSGLDAVAPSVQSATPAGGTTAVAISTAVTVTFSEPMDRASTQSAFSLRRSGDGAAVAGSFSWSGSAMTFRPTAALAGDTLYTASVGTGATDAAGNRLGEWTSSFTTAATVSASPFATAIETGSLRSGGASQLVSDDNAYYAVNSTTTSTRVASWYGRVSGVGNALRDLEVSYKGANSRSCTQTVSIWNWATNAWVQLDSRSVGTTEVLVTRAAGGTLADYVSGATGDGEVRVRVRCTTSGGSFHAAADQLRVAFTRA